MADLPVYSASGTGTVITPQAAAGGGDRAQCGAKNHLVVINGSGAGITVTVDSVAPCSFGSDHNLVVVVAAGATALIGPLPSERYAALSDQKAAVTYSGVGSLTCWVDAP